MKGAHKNMNTTTNMNPLTAEDCTRLLQQDDRHPDALIPDHTPEQPDLLAEANAFGKLLWEKGPGDPPDDRHPDDLIPDHTPKRPASQVEADAFAKLTWELPGGPDDYD